jgi:hypothetical protein
MRFFPRRGIKWRPAVWLWTLLFWPWTKHWLAEGGRIEAVVGWRSFRVKGPAWVRCYTPIFTFRGREY